MEKRTVLAFLLIFIIYWFSSQYLWKPATPEPENKVETSQTETIPAPRDSQSLEVTISEQDDFPSTIWTQADFLDNDIILENEKMSVSFSNRGALINQIIIKDFFLSDKITPVALIPENQAILQVYFSNNVLSNINETLFLYDIENNDTSQTIIFSVLNEETNSVIKKRFTLFDDYRLDFFIEGENMQLFEGYSLSLNSGIEITEDNKAAVKDIKNSFKFVAQVDREYQDLTLAKLARGEQTFAGKINWAAVRSKYFVMSLIPSNSVMTQAVRTQRVNETLGFDLFIRYNARVSNIYDHYEMYFGPVDYDALLAYNNGMEHIAELGAKWLRPLAKVFVYYIALLHRAIPNYGLVIIVFALTLKILLAPLTSKALTSGRKMQKVQPLMKEIQNKYKNDIKKQQEELRNLYKEHNVSPLGGCLPLLLQMPIFFALYPVLRFSIDFRQASFFGWLSDLSEPDPYWILPILMGVFMFIQQKMTQAKQDTTNMDEKQLAMVQSQKMMMYMMPPFMVFIFSNLPAGLVLYWTTFNVFSIIQQHYLNKKLD